VTSVKESKGSSVTSQNTCARSNHSLSSEIQDSQKQNSSLFLDEQFQSLSISDSPEGNIVRDRIEQDIDFKKEQTCLHSQIDKKSKESSNSTFGTGHQEVFYYVSSDETSLNIFSYGTKPKSGEQQQHGISFSSIGGLETQIQAVREMIEMPLKYPEMFTDYGMLLYTISYKHCHSQRINI